MWASEQEPQAVAAGVPGPVIAFLRERMLRSAPEGLVAMGKYLVSCPDQTAALAELAGMPILVLYGENDNAWAPATQNRMAKKLGAQQLHPGGGALPRGRGSGNHGKHTRRVLERGREQLAAAQDRHRSQRAASVPGPGWRAGRPGRGGLGLGRRALGGHGLGGHGLGRRALGGHGLGGHGHGWCRRLWRESIPGAPGLGRRHALRQWLR